MTRGDRKFGRLPIDFSRVPNDNLIRRHEAGAYVMSDHKNQYERYFLRLLEHGPFERRSRGGWRFGTKVISDTVVERLLACGRAEVAGRQVKLKSLEGDP